MSPVNKIIAGIAGAGILATGGTIATDQIINPYDTVGTTLQAETISKLPEAGTEKAIMDTTKPKMTLSKWNGEVNMGVTYDGMQANGARPFLSKNVEWKQGAQTMQVVPLEASSTMEDGGYEINIILDSKPASNVFNFSIDNANQLDFFYQPALTDEEVKEGMYRSDNVVGSYAVYYKDHANHIEGQTNYATGKAYHIFRPLITDASGVTTWAGLSYSNGILTVTVPQKFLDDAVYPVKIDPTFGYTSQGASDTALTDATHQNAVAEKGVGIIGTFTTASGYLKVSTGGTNNFGQDWGVMIDSSGIPNNAFLDDNFDAGISGASYILYNVTMTQNKSMNGTYWATIVGSDDGTNHIFIATDTGGSAGIGAVSINAGAWSSNTNLYSIYATYTVPAPTINHAQIYIKGAQDYLTGAQSYVN